MALLTVQKISLGLSGGTYSGLNPSFVAAVGPDTFVARDNRTFLVVKNGGGGSINVTVASILNCNQGHDHDPVIAVTNGQERWFGPFKPSEFTDANDIVTITYSGVASVTVAAFSLAEQGR